MICAIISIIERNYRLEKVIVSVIGSLPLGLVPKGSSYVLERD
jgi:hypothetical protein